MTHPLSHPFPQTKEWQAQSVPKSFKRDHQHDAPLPNSSEKVEVPREVTEERHDDVEDAPGGVDAMGGVTDSSSPADSERFDYDLTDVINVAPDYSPSSFDSGVKTFVLESPYPPGSVVGEFLFFFFFFFFFFFSSL